MGRGTWSWIVPDGLREIAEPLICRYQAEVFNDKLREWEDYYNYHRPHGGLGGQTPYERLKQKTTTQA